jgi:hypothetical protein
MLFASSFSLSDAGSSLSRPFKIPVEISPVNLTIATLLLARSWAEIEKVNMQKVKNDKIVFLIGFDLLKVLSRYNITKIIPK